MGLIQSLLCSFTFCIERVLTWTCCAFVLILLMLAIIVLIVYGISIGYHYAQKELARTALKSRSSSEAPPPLLRINREVPSMRMLAINVSEIEQPPQPQLEVYRRQGPKENMYIDQSESPIVLLQTEKPPEKPELAPHEKEIAKHMIGRFRRSRNITSTTTTPTNFYRAFADRFLTNVSIV